MQAERGADSNRGMRLLRLAQRQPKAACLIPWPESDAHSLTCTSFRLRVKARRLPPNPSSVSSTTACALGSQRREYSLSAASTSSVPISAHLAVDVGGCCREQQRQPHSRTGRMDTTSWATLLMQARPGSIQSSQHVQHGPLECSPTLPTTLTLQRVGQHSCAFQRRICALPQRGVHAMRCISNEHHPPAGQLAAPRQRAAIGDGRVQQLWCSALDKWGAWGGEGGVGAREGCVGWPQHGSRVA